jgi:hypothetical protein
MTIYLYIKQHSITGLKYFGRTISDPYVYNGSGKYWVPHCKKHGDDLIETLNIWNFEDQESCTEFALKFSIENNIVESEEWANLVLEDGTHSNGEGQRGIKRSESIKIKISNSMKGKTKSEEHKRKISLSLKGKPSPLKGRPNTPEHNQNISRATKGKRKKSTG